MRDPDLIVRAQQAATALESAWCHWRNMHGLGVDPLPSVSSYVGYSLDAPWGQPRIIFGVSAAEAEQLAVLLDRHDCVGPVHASVTAKPVGGLQEIAGAHAQDGGFVHVPAPAPASAGQQPLPTGATSAHQPSLGPPRGSRHRDSATVTALTSPSAPGSASVGTPIAWAASRAVEASLASRRNAADGRPAAQVRREGESSAAAAEGSPDGGDRPAPAVAGGAEPTDDAAPTAVGGIPPVPATQPYPCAGPTSTARPESKPGIVPFRPRSESGSHQDSRPSGQPATAAAAAAADTVAWALGESAGQATIADTAV